MKQKRSKKLVSQKTKRNKAFTLIELLVVIAVIGLLATIVSVSVNTARSKARDAQRIASLKQIQTALEMYYDANNQYPNIGYYAYVDDSGCGYQWCVLETALLPYMPSLPRDPRDGYYMYYDSDPGDSYQSYGLMAIMEHSANYNLASGDGGYYNSNGYYYEVGPQPTYCRNKYAGGSGNWWGTATNVCGGGN